MPVLRQVPWPHLGAPVVLLGRNLSASLVEADVYICADCMRDSISIMNETSAARTSAISSLGLVNVVEIASLKS